MEAPNTMPTLSHVLDILEKKGMGKDFKWTGNGFTLDGQKMYAPNELTIVKMFRFEELKDASDTSIVYLIEANDGAMGYILDAYGPYRSHDEEGFDNALRLIPEKDHNEQMLFEL